MAKKRSTILSGLKETAGNTPQRGSDIEKTKASADREEILSNLRTAAAGGDLGGSRINEAYAEYRQKKEQARADRYNSLVRDAQSLFDENGKLNSGVTLPQLAQLSQRTREVYKERTDSNAEYLRSLDNYLKRLAGGQMAYGMTRGLLPEEQRDALRDQIAGVTVKKTQTPQERRAQDEAAEREASGYVSPENYAASIRANKRAADRIRSGGVIMSDWRYHVGRSAQEELDRLAQSTARSELAMRAQEDETAAFRGSDYWLQRANELEQKRKASRSGYGGMMQGGTAFREVPEFTEQDRQDWDKAREYYYQVKNAERWGSMPEDLRQKALEAAGYVTDGVLTWQTGDEAALAGMAPDQRAQLQKDQRARRNQIAAILAGAGYEPEEVIEYASRVRNAERMQQEMSGLAGDVTGSGAEGVARGVYGTAQSYVTNLLSPIGSVGLLAQKLFRSGAGAEQYRPVDYNTPSMYFSQSTSTIRGAVGGQMGDVGRFFYDTVNSAVDSGVRMLVGQALGGGGFKISPDMTEEAAEKLNRFVSGFISTQMSGEVFANSFVQAKENGSTDADALLDSVTAALIEGLTEKYSVESILSNPNGLTWTALRNSFLSEGSEEMASDFLNTIYDELKNGDDSELRTQYRELLASGATENDAFNQVFGDYVKQVVLDGLAGGLSGIAMSGAAEYMTNKRYEAAYADPADTQALLDEVRAVNPDSRILKQAEQRVAKGKGITGYQARELMGRNEEKLVPLKQASEKYGRQSGAMQATYQEGQDVAQYDMSYRVAYEMGKAGAKLSAAQTSEATDYLTDAQKQAAWYAGRDARTQLSDVSEVANGRALLNGQIAEVQTVSAQDGKLMAEVRQGETVQTVALDSLKVDAGTRTLAEGAKQYGSAAGTIFEQYKAGQDVAAYLRAADTAAAVGMASPSASSETVLKNLQAGQLGKALSGEQITAIYKAGQTAGRAQLRKTGMTRLGTGTVTFEQTAKGAKLNARQKASVQFIRDLAKVTGIDFTIYQSSADSTGRLQGANGAYRDGTVHVDLNAGASYEGKLENASMLRTVSHELTHYMAEAAQTEFSALQDFMVQRLSQWEGHSIQDLVEGKMATAEQAGHPITAQEALEEVVADGCEMMLRDSKAVRRLAEENRTLFEKVRDWMKKFFDSLKKAFDGVEAVHPESFHMMENYAEELQKLWDEAFTAAVENAKASGQKNSAPAGADVQFSDRSVNGQRVVWIENSDLSASQLKDPRAIAQYIAEHIGEVYRIIESGQRVFIGKELPSEYTHSKYTSYLQKNKQSLLKAKNKAASGLGEMIEIATNRRWEKTKHTASKDAKFGMYRYDTRFAFPVLNQKGNTVNVRAYDAELLIRNASDGRKYLYDIVNIKENTANALDLRHKEARKGSYQAATQGSVSDGASQLTGASSSDATSENGSASAPNSTVAQDKGGSQEERFSMRTPVEETRDLIAVHNLTEENLESSLNLGGLPSPSIAIIKAEQGHSEYGPISIVFDKSTIDPQADSRNKIYGSDAWTPTAPKVEYQVNSKKLSQVERELHRLAGDSSVAGGIFGNSSALRSMGIDDTSNLNRKQLAEKLASTDTVRAAYLADRGRTLEPVKMDKVWDKYGNDTLRKVIDRLGVDTLAEMEANLEAGESAENALGENAEVIRDILRDYYREQGEPMLRRMAVRKHWTAAEISEKRQTRIDNSLANVSVFTLEDIVRHAWEMYQDGGNTKGEIDRSATREKLREAANAEDVQAWIGEKLDGLLGKAGIYNGKDRYTPAGNSRSFAQLHYDYTLENIVRAMNGLQQARGEGIWGASAESFVAVGTPDYRSIDEVRADKGRLREATEEEYDALKAKLDPMIEEIINGVRSSNKAHSDNQFEEIDIIGSLLLDAAKGTKTKAAIRNVFRKNGYTISDALIAKAQSLYSEAAKMPTKYFEAKPQRAVSFDEAKAIIVPDNTSAALVQRLEQGGANVISYKAGDEQARLAALNAQEGVKFSERDYSYEALTEKPDMEVTEVSGTTLKSRADIIFQAKQNAAKIGTFDPKTGSVSVYVKDIGTDVVLATNGLKHSLDRRFGVNAPVVLKAGEILQNSIRINEMTPKKEGATASYVLIGAARNSAGELSVVRSVVNRFRNEVTSMDVLYAMSAKKEPAALLPRLAENSAIRTDSTISIRELLGHVNEYFPDVLPQNVLEHYGRAQRPETELGRGMKYQERDVTITPAEILDEINLDAVKGAAVYDALRDYKNALAEREDIRQKLEAQQDLAQTGPAGDRVKAKNRAGVYQKQFDRADTKVKQLRRNTALRQFVESEMAYVNGRQDALNQADAVHGRYTERFEQRLEEAYQINRTVQERYASMAQQYGTIPAGETPARTVAVPKRTEKGNRVSRTVRTAMEAQATTEEGVRALKKAVVEGNFSYLPITDKAAGSKATETIKDKGYQKALADWTVSMSKGHPGKDAVALGFQLYNQALNSGDTKTAVQVLSDLASRVREGAQMVQAVRMLKKLSPDNQLYSVQLSLKALQEDVDGRYGKKAPKLKLNETLVNNLLEAENEVQKEAAQKAIYRDIASQLPHTFMDRWNSWRYLCMLGNVRTHVRNILGNAGFVPVRRMKDAVALGIEAAYSKAKGGNVERSKGFVLPNSDLYKLAKADYKNIADLITGGGKYNDAASGIESMKSAFGEKGVWKYLSKIADANSFALDAEDVWWFSKPAYAQSLAGYLKANKITAEQFNADEAIRDKARAYAVKEAQRATYRDYNDFSDFIAKVGRTKRGGGTTAKVASTLMEGVLPFRRTPANILVRGVEYSPIGLAQGIYQATRGVKTGKYTAAQAIDRISSGLTGTALVALGALLTAHGILTPPDDDDEKQAGFDKLRGAQSYALKIGKTYVTVDWLAPEALPVFVGSQLSKLFSGDSEGGLKALYSALTTISEPMLEMSMLSSLQDVIENVSYADSKLMAILSTAATNYLTQAFPTLAGQIERITESERETTFATEDSPLTKDLQYILAKIMNKTPGEFQQIPYIDAWGRHEDTGTVLARAFNNLLNPAYLSYDKSEPFEDELQRLYDLGYNDLLPQRVKQSQKVEGETLTQDQYVTFAETKGKTQYEALKGIIGSSWYQELSDAARGDLLGMAYSYADGVAKLKVNKDADVSKWIREAQAAVEDGGDISEILRDRLDEDVIDFQTANPQYADLSDNQIHGYLEYCEPAGVPLDTVYNAAQTCKNFEGDKDSDGKTISGSKKQKVVDYIQGLGLSREQERALWDALKGNWKDTDTPWE